jgi:hypothetical protein
LLNDGFTRSVSLTCQLRLMDEKVEVVQALDASYKFGL